MKGATECARRLKRLIRSLRAKLGKGGHRTSGDAVTQMILGIFSRNVPESKARAALDRLRNTVVDYNELRVVPAIEMAETLGGLPDARLKSEDLSRSLNALFKREHAVSFDSIAGASRKEIIAYIDGLNGLDPYTRARVRLYGLGQHAVPLDEAMWAYARKTGIVAPQCSLEEAQSFLERRLSEKEAPEVVALLEKQAWAEMGAAVRNGQVERIRSVPPDRTSRNMLQMVAAGQYTSPGMAARPSDSKSGDGKKDERVAKPAAAKPSAAAKNTPPEKTKSSEKPKPPKKPKPPEKSKPAARPSRKKASAAKKTKASAPRKARSASTRKKTAKAGAKATPRTKRAAGKQTRRKAAKTARRSSAKAKSA